MDVTSSTFQAAVIDRSKELPVVVLCWAAWAGPARALKEVLEHEVAARAGKVELAEVDADASADLVQTLQVTVLPAVRAFRAGEVTGRLDGPQQLAAVDRFLDSVIANGTGTGSDFVELTWLGDIPSRYPSFSAAFRSLASGTVVATPAAYGIVHGSHGCRAEIDAIVDTAPSTASATRFRCSFVLGPVVDPVDMARFAADLATAPQAEGANLRPVLPHAMAVHGVATFSAAMDVEALTWTAGADPGTFELSFDVADTGSGESLVPAWATMNRIAAELTAARTPAPLLGTIPLQLDDAYPTPPTASFFLALGATASGDDLSVEVGGAPAVATATNRSPNALHLVRAWVTSALGGGEVAVGQTLAAGASLELATREGGDVAGALVNRRLAISTPFPRGQLPSYVTIQTQTIQQIQHLVTVDASAVDFAAEGIAELAVQITATGLPGVEIAPLVLTAGQRVGSETLLLPIGVAVSGLDCDLLLSVTPTDGSTTRQVELANDFLARPIFTLVPADLRPPL